MKNELCISSLTRKSKTWLFQNTDWTIIVLNNYYYAFCHWVKNEMLILGIASITVTSPQSSTAAFPIPVYISVTDTATTATTLIERARLQQCPSHSLSRKPTVHLHLQKLCCKPAVHRVLSVPNNFNKWCYNLPRCW